MIVIGDVHGCFHTLMNLINKLPYTDKICFVGDLIDRGLNSKQVVQFIMNNDYTSVMGNHEDLMTDHSLWFRNGGWATIKSFVNDPIDEWDKVKIFNESKEKKWLESLPVIIEWENFIISHSYAYAGDKTPVDDLLWGRVLQKKPQTDKICIFGHTPFKKVVDFNNKQCYCVDTGCVFGYSLSAIDLKTMKTYSVPLDARDTKR